MNLPSGDSKRGSPKYSRGVTNVIYYVPNVNLRLETEVFCWKLCVSGCVRVARDFFLE